MTNRRAGDRASESFRGLLLLHRGRTGLTQRQLADRVGVSPRSVQDWELGVNYPSAERLQGLIAALLEGHGLTLGHEQDEAEALWSTVEYGSPRMHTPFDTVWFTQVLERRASLTARSGRIDDERETTLANRTGRAPVERRQDWGDAPDVFGFVGRADEMATLTHWVMEDRCRLVALLGLGGVGKTSLAANLAQQVAPSFERVYWRSLRDAPPFSEWLAGTLRFLSDQQMTPPAGETERLAALLGLLRERPCLLVLDNFETLFEPDQGGGRYRAGRAGYGRVLAAVGEAAHQSCVLLTSREAPVELTVLRGDTVRTIRLGGLGIDEARILLGDKRLIGDAADWVELVARYAGNALALRLIGETIRQVFGGEIRTFLEDASGRGVFGGVRQLLAEQVERSSATERQVLQALAVGREPLRLTTLAAAIDPGAGRGATVEAMEGLRRRSLVEHAEAAGVAAFTLQSVVLEYVTDRLVEQVADEIELGRSELLVGQPLIRAQASEYVRQSQERLIGEPIVRQLQVQNVAEGAERHLLALLDGWRDRPSTAQGYGPGNVVNLLRLLRGDLRGLDLSRLAIRQAYLAEVDAQNASLADAQLADSVLAEGFHFPGAVALSGDGTLLAAGTTTGEIWLWRVADRTPLWAVQGHPSTIWSVALSDDGRLLASGGGDGMVRLWEASTGQLVATLEGHTGTVWGVSLSADGRLLVSGGYDGTVRLWESTTARPLTTFQGLPGTVRDVALSADGRLIASGGLDGEVRLWEASTGRPLTTLQGHSGGVSSVTLSADGRLVASSGYDGTVRLWEAGTGQLVMTLEGHTGTVRDVALSSDGRLVASGGQDGAVRLWETESGRLAATLEGHTGTVWGLAVAADSRLAASGGGDGTVRLWEASTGRPLATLQGHPGTVREVALSADGRLVACGGEDGVVRLWESSTGQPLATLQGHTGAVRDVALSTDGRLVVSGGRDGTVRLWDAPTGRPLATLAGHTGAVWSVALSTDGRLLVSGGSDGTVRLWDASAGRLLATREGHTGVVRGVALSADGQLLVSGGEDGAVRLWEATTGQPLATFEGHTGAVWDVTLSADGGLLAAGTSTGQVALWRVANRELMATREGHTGAVWRLALSGDGRLLASGGGDGVVRLWDAITGQSLVTLEGHAGAVWGIAVSADGRLVASGGGDETVRLWDASTGTPLHVLRPERRYERLDVTGLSGITDAQRLALRALGALERPG